MIITRTSKKGKKESKNTDCNSFMDQAPSQSTRQSFRKNL